VRKGKCNGVPPPHEVNGSMFDRAPNCPMQQILPTRLMTLTNCDPVGRSPSEGARHARRALCRRENQRQQL
jgi:hypothetical protein